MFKKCPKLFSNDYKNYIMINVFIKATDSK